MPLAFIGILLGLGIGFVGWVLAARNMTRGVRNTFNQPSFFGGNQLDKTFDNHVKYMVLAAIGGLIFVVSGLIFLVRDVFKIF